MDTKQNNIDVTKCGKWYPTYYITGEDLTWDNDPSVTYASFIFKVTPNKAYTLKKVNTIDVNNVINKRFYVLGFTNKPSHKNSGKRITILNTNETSINFTTTDNIKYIACYLGYHRTEGLDDYQCIIRDVQLLTEIPEDCANPDLPEGGKPIKPVGGPYPDCDEEGRPQPTPEGGEIYKPCSNTGQFGGGGTPLKDIKLFLYANKVTKGTITLSKPQVEVGTYATDWRPNPADVTKSIEMMLKQIESERKGGRKNGKKRD